MTGARTEATRRLRGVAGPVVRRTGALTSGLRQPPSLVVVGTQRGGTTSLFRTLRQHPAFVGPVHRKGVHYFDVEYHRGPEWYLGHFPLRATISRRARKVGADIVVGEASPYYMAHPLAPGRIDALLPDAKIVVLLRDPIERAYSAYTHERARGYEQRSFEEALRDEPAMVEVELARTLAEPDNLSEPLRHNAYLTRGHYVEQLRRMEGVFGRDRMLVLDSHRFFGDPESEFDRLLEFLGLRPFDGLTHDRHNARPRVPLADHLEEELAAHFAPWDAELAAWLGWTPSWMGTGPA
jgi:hypothetical protein